MKKTHTLTTIQFLYIVVLCLALFLRLVNLNDVPLSENEAHHALCAMDANRAGCEGESGLYGFFTNLLFHLFGESNFASRLLPAIAGSLLVLLPLIMDSYLDKKTGMVVAGCLALDPILIQVSRSADATMIAVVLILFMVAFALKQDYKTTVILFMFGLLCGPTFWLGIFLLICSYGITRHFAKKKNQDFEWIMPKECSFVKEKNAHSVGIIVLITWVAISTHFFTVPAGFLSPVQSFATLLTGRWQPTTGNSIPSGIKLIGLLLYAAFGICLSIAAMIRRKSNLSVNQIFYIVGFGIAVIILLLPGMPFMQSVWSIIPVWFLAAGEIIHLAENAFIERKHILIPTLVGAVILIYLGLQTVRIRYLLSVGMNFQENIYLLIVPLLLIFVFILLYAYGWSGTLAKQVLAILFLACGCFGLWRNANRAANLTGTAEYELIQQGYFVHNAEILQHEIEQYRVTHGAFPEDIDIGLTSSDREKSLEWLLRDYNVVPFSEISNKNVDNFDIVITQGEKIQEYTGFYKQSLALVSNVKIFKGDYSGFLPKEILEWMIYRRGTLELQNYTLWFKF
ncbi:MAG: putative membrane protein [Anaerolinea thermophila]|uniref:Putative membrane protein n=1 Tax=Anaerolinea thermophila TaxID=167964 RepID=A0A101FYA7_9CHLR|nr:MAG: putative membrane protein [Anaerolinea thermophila]